MKFYASPGDDELNSTMWDSDYSGKLDQYIQVLL